MNSFSSIKIFFKSFCIAVSLTSQLCYGQENAPGPHDLFITVLDFDKKPASGQKVKLLGIDPESSKTLEQVKKLHDFNFVANRDGKCFFTFPPLTPGNDLSHNSQPLASSFRAIVEPTADHAGAISPVFQYGTNYAVSQIASEEEIFTLHKALTTCSLILERGTEFEGLIVDENFTPLPAKEIIAANCLDEITGGIFKQTCMTDQKGHYSFHNLNINKLFIEPFDSKLYWTHSRYIAHMKASRPQAWNENRFGMIRPIGAARKVQFDMMVALRQRYKLYGDVIDEEGKPISGATIRIGISNKRTPVPQNRVQRNYFFLTSDQDGKYQTALGYPWLETITVSKDGYEPIEMGSGSFLGTGEQNFRLLKKSPRNPHS